MKRRTVKKNPFGGWDLLEQNESGSHWYLIFIYATKKEAEQAMNNLKLKDFGIELKDHNEQ